jgi:hypothetical protein
MSIPVMGSEWNYSCTWQRLVFSSMSEDPSRATFTFIN